MNKLIIIGFLSDKHCYLNVSKEEAISRYLKITGQDSMERYITIEEISFKDYFMAYEIYEAGHE